MIRMSQLALAAVVFGALQACMGDGETIQEYNAHPPAIVEAVENPRLTRAQGVSLSSFSLYCVDEWWEYTGQMYADNIVYTKGATSWSSSEPFYMSDWSAMYAYAVSPNTDLFPEKMFTLPEQSFTYTNPSGSDEQTYLKVASSFNFTIESTSNRLSLTFNDVMFSLFFQGFSGFENADIKVKSITIHNLPGKAKFTFSKDVESWGAWQETADNVPVYYGQELAEATPVTTYDFADLQNEPFVLFPIEPTPWDRNSETFQQAKDNGHCYIEVKCQMTQEKDGKTYYLWGYEDPTNPKQYESIFYPYEQMYCTSTWEPSYNGYYYLFIDDSGCDEKGTSPIKPHPETGGDTEFKVSSQVEFMTKVKEHGGTADEWTPASDNNTVEIKM
ncbi:MAG: hypothetical protein IJ551_11895 [Prevotella sp.]|nr:hypothetical protein [Prevotella sp.]